MKDGKQKGKARRESEKQGRIKQEKRKGEKGK